MATPPLSPGQFRYGVFQGAGQQEGIHVLAAHPTEDRIVGSLSFKKPETVGRGRGRPRQQKVFGAGQNVSVAFVAPDVQRQGIGTTMYNIASHELGYRPQHDVVLTPKGLAWARAVGGHRPMDRSVYHWEEGGEKDAAAHVTGVQWPNFESSTKVDPTIANALAPYKAPKQRRRKQPKQLDFGFEGV